MNDPWDTLARAITRLGDRIDALPGIREATVTATAPLEVTFDTDTLGTLVFGSLAHGLQPGNRVLTVRLARYVWILGRRGGTASYAHVVDEPAETDAPDTFEQGVTVSDVNDGDDGGFPPGADEATLLTVRHGDERAFQLLSAKTSPRLWHRGVNEDGSAWEPWEEVATRGQGGVPYAQAAGTVNINHPTNTAFVVGVTITLPAGRFTQAPIPSSNLLSAPNGSQKCSPRIYANSTSSLTAAIYQGDLSGVNVAHNDLISWTAVQMTAASAAG